MDEPVLPCGGQNGKIDALCKERFRCGDGVCHAFRAGYMKVADMDIVANRIAMQEIVAARIEAIRQAHANNLIENMDMGADVLEAILQRACEPISNEEFTRREKALWLQRHRLVTGAAA